MFHHPILLGFIGGLLIARLALRRLAWRRRWAAEGSGGSCAARCGSGLGRGGRGWFARRRGGWGGVRSDGAWGGAAGGATGDVARAPAAPTPPVALRLDSVVAGLELNRRQGDEIGEVLGQLRDAVGASRFGTWAALPSVLDAVAGEPFDRARVEQLLAGDVDPLLLKDAVDGLEHAHTILTSEQRDRLRRLAAVPRA